MNIQISDPSLWSAGVRAVNWMLPSHFFPTQPIHSAGNCDFITTCLNTVCKKKTSTRFLHKHLIVYREFPKASACSYLVYKWKREHRDLAHIDHWCMFMTRDIVSTLIWCLALHRTFKLHYAWVYMKIHPSYQLNSWSLAWS